MPHFPQEHSLGGWRDNDGWSISPSSQWEWLSISRNQQKHLPVFRWDLGGKKANPLGSFWILLIKNTSFGSVFSCGLLMETPLPTRNIDSIESFTEISFKIGPLRRDIHHKNRSMADISHTSTRLDFLGNSQLQLHWDVLKRRVDSVCPNASRRFFRKQGTK